MKRTKIAKKKKTGPAKARRCGLRSHGPCLKVCREAPGQPKWRCFVAKAKQRGLRWSERQTSDCIHRFHLRLSAFGAQVAVAARSESGKRLQTLPRVRGVFLPPRLWPRLCRRSFTSTPTSMITVRTFDVLFIKRFFLMTFRSTTRENTNNTNEENNMIFSYGNTPGGSMLGASDRTRNFERQDCERPVQSLGEATRMPTDLQTRTRSIPRGTGASKRRRRASHPSQRQTKIRNNPITQRRMPSQTTSDLSPKI